MRALGCLHPDGLAGLVTLIRAGLFERLKTSRSGVARVPQDDVGTCDTS